MNTTHYLKTAMQALAASTLIVAIAMAGYFFMEPQVGRAQDTSGPFTISQVITGETSFIVDALNTTLTGSINGITGGQSNGSTTVVVQTNSATGYTMSIAFATNTTPNAMLGNTSASESIRDYPAVGGQPTFLFSTASTSAVFAYTVSAANSADLDQSFDDNGSACNQTGNANTADRCWMEPTQSNFQIIDRSTAAISGATSTLHFRVHVPNNPTPGLVADTYTATATLTVAPQ
jgi:hypothetical protein